MIAGVGAVTTRDIELLAQLADTGALRPVIDRCYPLADAANAHAYVDTGRKRGSVVLRVVDPAPTSSERGRSPICRSATGSTILTARADLVLHTR